MTLYRALKLSEADPNKKGKYTIYEGMLEVIEPSPDIQKRAEELLPCFQDEYGYPAHIENVNKSIGNVREKAIQLATEAVAAEREKYEKEIREMREENKRLWEELRQW